MAEQQNQLGGLFDGVFKSMNDILTAQGKLIGKSIEVQSSLMDAVNKNATDVLGTFTKKVNEALSGTWTGFGGAASK
ncbi:hypothetical protein Ctha_1685 [Chloroherpeton thalassium ATCC 35110]|uniref:Chlorosome envelope protein B n=1 Tax=Chloroherpeton thalassium (strain ATCC 35110 / GB-78) TaxID=517418 RepID=B3QT43_CHLT3|nr:hypothetical protein [Chloroherpeton thalassium]ACF14142.1 hypothetical protein Ctha_1685 [Chloroherpeton thalassium ATCC 35110]